MMHFLLKFIEKIEGISLLYKMRKDNKAIKIVIAGSDTIQLYIAPVC